MRSSRGGTRAALFRSTVAAAMVAAASCTHAPPATAPTANPRAERALASDLNRIFAAPVMEHGLWGVAIKSLDTGKVIYALNARKLMMPASNMKIVTLVAAAEILGWDYRFKTTLETDAEIQGGSLKGNLIVRGSGDPTINSRDDRARVLFDEWAAALKAAGVTRIEGNIVADATAFDSRGLGQGWSWDYLEAGYAAPSGALEFNENIATLTIRPGAKAGDPAQLELPPSTGLALLHNVVTGAAGSATTISFERSPASNDLDVTGSIAVGASPATRAVSVANPALYFAHSLTLALIERGIPVRGIPVAFQRSNLLPPLPRTAIVETQSPPLRAIATTMMKVSQNLYAETLLKAIGATGGAPATAAAGRAAAQRIFDAWAIEPGSYVQADGSGLSRYDYVTADMIVRLLERMHTDARHRDAFHATLPIAGKDGTISTRMRGTRAEANAVAKTGSISNVRALSGYVKTRDGETLAFSILANNFTIPATTVTWMTDLAVETLANFTRR